MLHKILSSQSGAMNCGLHICLQIILECNWLLSVVYMLTHTLLVFRFPFLVWASWGWLGKLDKPSFTYFITWQILKEIEFAASYFILERLWFRNISFWGWKQAWGSSNVQKCFNYKTLSKLRISKILQKLTQPYKTKHQENIKNMYCPHPLNLPWSLDYLFLYCHSLCMCKSHLERWGVGETREMANISILK